MDKIKVLFSNNKELILLITGSVIFIVAVATASIINPFRILRIGFLNFGQSESLIIKISASPSARPLMSPVEGIKILFFGDLMLDRNIRLAAQKNGYDFILADLGDLLINSDLVMANLEGPITDNQSVSVGSSPGSTRNFIFTFAPEAAPALFGNNIRLVNLGNNHILNFGEKGLEATKKYLDAAQVAYFGAPAPSAGAPNNKRSAIKEVKGLRIGFVGYNQFIGDLEQERFAVVEEIKKIKAEADIVILYAHWGIEYAAEANNAIKNLAHEFIDAGADLVIGSHPHVTQQAEEYKSKRIYYSLGNFVFDQYFSEATRQGLGVLVKIDPASKRMEFEEIKTYLQSNGQTILQNVE